ncbi:MAG: hypothetical protein M9889_25495, partial [Shinella sp.]|nr:hypothetical protein [Shinella sp.]
ASYKPSSETSLPERFQCPPTAVILGLDPRIHAAPAAVDGRVEPDHDGGEVGGRDQQSNAGVANPGIAIFQSIFLSYEAHSIVTSC